MAHTNPVALYNSVVWSRNCNNIFAGSAHFDCSWPACRYCPFQITVVMAV